MSCCACSAVWCVVVWCNMVWYGMICHLCYVFFIFTGGSKVDWNSLKDRNRLLVVSNFIS